MAYAISTSTAGGASRTLAATGLVAVALSLAGCGSGDPDSGPVTDPAGAAPATVSQSGVVIAEGAVSGAVVCLDLDKNGQCDAGEPASSATDAQGHYTIGGVTQALIDSSPLVAAIPATAVDAAHPGVAVGTAYVLSGPAGQGAVISPVTRLVQSAIAQGLARSAAEAAVAAQLQVGAASLYDDYAGASGANDAALSQLAPALAALLQQGAALSIGATADAPTGAGYWVRSLAFTSRTDYALRYFSVDGTQDSNGLHPFHDHRVQEVAGQAVAFTYDTVTATPSGWVTYDDTTAGTHTAGSPDVSSLNGYGDIETRTVVDVGGKTLAEVVAMAQDPAVNTQSTLAGVDGQSLTAILPAGSQVLRVTAAATSTPVYYTPSPANTLTGAASIGGVAAQFPEQAVQADAPRDGNTLSMGNLHGDAGCGTGAATCAQESLRVAFGPASAASYYLCDLTVATGASSNCQAAGSGTYALTKAVDGLTPIMTFAGLPAAAGVQTFTRVLVQRGGAVYAGAQDKPVTVTTTRLNEVAFQALAAALGIAAPSVTDATTSPFPYAGTWSSSYSGADSGTCGSLTIDAQGHLSGTCTSTAVGGNFEVTGTVSANGSASFGATGSTDVGASFSGAFGSGTGSGSWSWPGFGSGTWTATRH